MTAHRVFFGHSVHQKRRRGGADEGVGRLKGRPKAFMGPELAQWEGRMRGRARGEASSRK